MRGHPIGAAPDLTWDESVVTPPTRKRGGFLRRWLTLRAEDQPGPAYNVPLPLRAVTVGPDVSATRR